MPDKPLIVIPAYNEADSINECVRGAVVHGDVCVVDDGSTDGTAEIVEAIDGATVIRHETNTHIAEAVADGFRYASASGYAHCVTMDAGLSHDPNVIPAFLAAKEFDLVLSRRDELIDVPLRRRVLSRTATLLINMALKRSVVPWVHAGFSDVTSGYRLYSRRAYEAVVARPLTSSTFDFHLEALARVYNAGYAVGEVPISYRYTNSSLRFPIIVDAVRTCGRIWTGRV